MKLFDKNINISLCDGTILAVASSCIGIYAYRLCMQSFLTKTTVAGKGDEIFLPDPLISENTRKFVEKIFESIQNRTMNDAQLLRLVTNNISSYGGILTIWDACSGHVIAYNESHVKNITNDGELEARDILHVNDADNNIPDPLSMNDLTAWNTIGKHGGWYAKHSNVHGKIHTEYIFIKKLRNMLLSSGYMV